MTKKTFTATLQAKTEHPVERFISVPTNEPGKMVEPTSQEEKPQQRASTNEIGTIHYSINPRRVQAKSRRLQLLVQPRLYEKVKAAADAEGLSVNEYIHQALDEKTREG